MQKQKSKQMFFGLFSFIKQELKKTKHNYHNPSQNETEFQAQISTMLPNLIKLMIARSIRAMEDKKLNQTAKRNSANLLQHKTPKKQEKFFEKCNKTLAYETQENQSKTKQKTQCKSQHKDRNDSVSRSSLF